MTNPVVTSVTVPPNATYGGGDVLSFAVNFDQAVLVDTTSGTPQIPIAVDTGGLAFATYVSGSGTSTLIFMMTVQDAQADGDGLVVGGGIDLNGGTLKDGLGNDAVTALNGIGSTSGVLIQNDPPTAVVLTGLLTSIAENASTILPLKIADIAITDVDGGPNLLSLAGADAGLFQLLGNQLFLRAGAHLDFETNPDLDLTVQVDGIGVGLAVDAFKALAIHVIDALEIVRGTLGPDRLIGTNHGEIILGLAGNDRIIGNGGNDRLIGGLGRDILTGGLGDDVFVFRSIADSAPHQSGYVNASFLDAVAGQGLRDIVTDFTHAQDRIDVSRIDANIRAAGDQAFVWRGTGNFTHTAGQLIERIYNPAGTTHDKTVIYGDFNGDRPGACPRKPFSPRSRRDWLPCRSAESGAERRGRNPSRTRPLIAYPTVAGWSRPCSSLPARSTSAAMRCRKRIYAKLHVRAHRPRERLWRPTRRERMLRTGARLLAVAPFLREVRMALYVTLSNFTDQGVKAIKDTPKRAEAFKAAAAKHGVKVHQVLWTLGQYDVLTIVEADDDIAATALALSVAALGNVRGQTLKAFDTGDMAKIIAKLA